MLNLIIIGKILYAREVVSLFYCRVMLYFNYMNSNIGLPVYCPNKFQQRINSFCSQKVQQKQIGY